MRFVDYRCNDCGKVSELYMGENDCTATCEFCGSRNMARIFSAANLKKPSGGSQQSCSGSCSSCSGCG